MPRSGRVYSKVVTSTLVILGLARIALSSSAPHCRAKVPNRSPLLLPQGYGAEFGQRAAMRCGIHPAAGPASSPRPSGPQRTLTGAAPATEARTGAKERFGSRRMEEVAVLLKNPAAESRRHAAPSTSLFLAWDLSDPGYALRRPRARGRGEPAPAG